MSLSLADDDRIRLHHLAKVMVRPHDVPVHVVRRGNMDSVAVRRGCGLIRGRLLGLRFLQNSRADNQHTTDHSHQLPRTSELRHFHCRYLLAGRR